MTQARAIGAPEAAAAMARALLGPDWSVAAANPRAAAHGLLPEEAAAMAAARPARLREFAAGRRAAHAALRAAGRPDAAVPMAPDRAPVWPEGFVGSITHCDDACLAAAAPARAARGIGLDLEPGTGLDAGLLPEIATPRERDWLEAQPAGRRASLARLIFSAKEAAYKALYPLSGEVLDFDAMEIAPRPAQSRFTARLNRPVGPLGTGTVLPGRFALGSGLMLTAVVLGHRGEGS